jgi:hypothetical protein
MTSDLRLSMSRFPSLLSRPRLPLCTLAAVCALASPPGWAAPEAAGGPLFFKDAAGQQALPSRIVTQAGDTLRVYAQDCSADQVKFDESARRSRIVAETVSALKRPPTGLTSACAPTLSAFDYTLQKPSGSVLVTAVKAGEPVGSATVLTGPEEHWHLSLDVPVTPRKVKRYDRPSNSLVPTNAGNDLFLGVNYAFGDVLSRPERFVDALSVKALMRLATRPTDSLGLALAWNVPGTNSQGLGAVAVFAGHFWTREDELTGSVVRRNAHYAGSWRLGLSYNLDDALRWFKG